MCVALITCAIYGNVALLQWGKMAKYAYVWQTVSNTARFTIKDIGCRMSTDVIHQLDERGS